MSKGLIVLLSGLAVVFVLSMVTVGNVISFRNESVTYVKIIDAQINDMKAKYNEYFLKVKEAAQIPEKQMFELGKIYDKVVSGRSTNGALMKWITENNPHINQNTFTEIQRIIASGRADIYDVQKRHIDTVREYNTFITLFPSNFINHMFFNFKQKEPTLPIVDNVDEIFKTKQDKMIIVF